MSARSTTDKASQLNKTSELPNCDDPHLCDPHLIDAAKIKSIQTQMLPQGKAQRMAELFGMLGDANRLRILSVLSMQELCVHDLAATVGMSESAVSHQLRTLRNMRLVSYRKHKRKVYYRLLDAHVLELYEAVSEHIDEVRDES